MFNFQKKIKLILAKPGTFLKILILILIVYIIHPSLFFELIKNLFNNKFKLKTNNNQNIKEIRDFTNIGVATFILNSKDIGYLKKYNKIVKTLLFVNKFIFKNLLFIDKQYYIYANTELIRHFFIFPSIDNILRSNLDSLFKSILGQNYKMFQCLWHRHLHMPKDIKKEMYSNFWHFDFKRQKKKWLRIMIYLHDQSEVESIHWFDSKTSKEAFNNELYGRYRTNELPDLLAKSKHYTSPGKFGTIKIINTADLMHRAGLVDKNKIRDVIFVLLESDLDWPGDTKFLIPPSEKIKHN